MANLRFLFVLNFVFLLLAAKHSNAQSSMYLEDERLFYGGVIVGANFSQVDGDLQAGYNRLGLNVGGVLYSHLSSNIAVSLEMLYSQKGSRSKGPSLTNTPGMSVDKYNINLGYVELPIMLNYFDRRKSHFGAGFSYSYLAHYDEIIETNFGPVDMEPYKFRKSDVSVVIAGSLHLYKGLFLQPRFQYSIMNIRKNHNPLYGRSEQFNNNWALRLVYVF